MKWFGLELTEICFFYSYQKWHSKKCLNDALCHNCNIFTCTQSISMKLILLESYEADLSNSGYNIQFGEELTEIQTNLYSVCKHSDTFLAHCKQINGCPTLPFECCPPWWLWHPGYTGTLPWQSVLNSCKPLLGSNIPHTIWIKLISHLLSTPN